MTPKALVIIATISALLVWWDARRSGRRHAWLWSLSVFSAWIVAFPLYLWTRLLRHQRGRQH